VGVFGLIKIENTRNDLELGEKYWSGESLYLSIDPERVEPLKR
jgi:hypothetical protein